MTEQENCIFCKIVRGEISSSVIFEDEVCMAFMDIFPIKTGHCLLIPKKHYTNLFDADLDVVAHLAKKLAELTRKVNRAVKPEGILNVVANGSGAGQEVPHLHFHVIPRNHSDEFRFQFPKGYRDKMADRAELDNIAKKIRDA